MSWNHRGTREVPTTTNDDDDDQQKRHFRASATSPRPSPPPPPPPPPPKQHPHKPQVADDAKRVVGGKGALAGQEPEVLHVPRLDRVELLLDIGLELRLERLKGVAEVGPQLGQPRKEETLHVAVVVCRRGAARLAARRRRRGSLDLAVVDRLVLRVLDRQLDAVAGDERPVGVLGNHVAPDVPDLARPAEAQQRRVPVTKGAVGQRGVQNHQRGRGLVVVVVAAGTSRRRVREIQVGDNLITPQGKGGEKKIKEKREGTRGQARARVKGIVSPRLPMNSPSLPMNRCLSVHCSSHVVPTVADALSSGNAAEIASASSDGLQTGRTSLTTAQAEPNTRDNKRKGEHK